MYNNLGAITIKLSDSVTLSENKRIELLNKSIEYGLLEYKLAIEIGAIYLKNGASSVLEEAYTKLGNLAYSKGKPILAADAFKNAIKYVEVYKETKDSLFSKEKTNALTDMNVKYQTEKKEILINNLEKEKKINDERTRRQKTFNVALLVGIILLCGIVLLVYINYIQKKKANNILKQQKIEIEQKNINLFSQKNEIQIKNEEISSQRDLLIVTNVSLERKILRLQIALIMLV